MKFCCTFFTFLFSVYMCADACAQMREFTSMDWGDVLNLYDDAIIRDSGWVDFVDINVKRTLLIENDGVLAGRINICDGCTLLLQNDGDISGVHFVPGANSRLTQVINSEYDITRIDTDIDYVILVQNASGLSLNGVVDVARPNIKIILENSSLVLNGAITSAAEIELSGNVNLTVNGPVGDGPLLSNIRGDGSLNIFASSDNPLMATRAEIINRNLYVRTQRETDYVKILKNPTGEFLNALRISRPDDKLLRALDRAGGMRELRDIMSRSVRLRPINLMRPVRAMDAMDMFSGAMMGISGFSLSPDFIYNDDFYAGRVRLGLGGRVTDTITVGGAGFVGYIDATDDINDFSASVFGGNAYAIYDDGDYIGRVMLGRTVAKFDTDFVWTSHGIDSAPRGTDLYGMMDFGVRMNPADDFVFAPFVGGTASRTAVSDNAVNKFDANIGGDITTSGGTDDFAYDYGLRMRASARGDVGAALRISFWSWPDGAGVDMDVGIMRNDFGTTYRASVGGRAIF